MRVICAIGDPDAITADTEPRPQSTRTRGPMAPALRRPERRSMSCGVNIVLNVRAPYALGRNLG